MKLMGQEVILADSRGSSCKLILQQRDVAQAKARSDVTRSTPVRPSSESAATAPGADASPGDGVARASGTWHWGRSVLTPADAEHLAAAHMVHLGFQGVRVTQVSGDSGLDAIAVDAAAQVKFHAAPTGRPDIQQLRGAADAFRKRLFYATGYTALGIEGAQQLDVALFQFTPDGWVVAVNESARSLSARGHVPRVTRGPVGNHVLQSRQNRAVRWATQIESAARVPISDRRRRGAKQMRDRQIALGLLTQGLAELQDSDNPLYKSGRRTRMVVQAERTLETAAKVLGIRLR